MSTSTCKSQKREDPQEHPTPQTQSATQVSYLFIRTAPERSPARQQEHANGICADDLDPLRVVPDGAPLVARLQHLHDDSNFSTTVPVDGQRTHKLEGVLLDRVLLAIARDI